MKARVRWTVEANIEIDDSSDVVSRAQTEDWRGHFYTWGTGTAEEQRDGVIEMLARNIGVYNRQLTNMDGWADLPNDKAVNVGPADFFDAGVEILPSA